MTPNPSTVIHTMRQLKTYGCRMSYMDRATVKFITDNELVEQIDWPSTYIRITAAGAEYIAENGSQE